MLADHGELPSGKVFGHLSLSYQPLPYLGDLMFHALLRPMIDSPQPLLHEQPQGEWQKRAIRLTALGERVLQGRTNWLDCAPAERCVVGVHIFADQKPWVVSDQGQVRRR